MTQNAEDPMNQMYRKTIVGSSLDIVLNEMMSENAIGSKQSKIVMEMFDDVKIGFGCECCFHIFSIVGGARCT